MSMDAQPIRNPSLPAAYLRLLATSLMPRQKPGITEDAALPGPIEARLAADPARASRYREVCGIAEDVSPLLWPQVLGLPLHMALLSDRRLPGSVLGMVHLAQRVTWRGALPVNHPLDFRVSLVHAGQHRRGPVLAMRTRVQAGERYWHGESLILFRAGPGRERPESTEEGRQIRPPAISGFETARSETIECPPGTTWDYARVSGDYNPIHLGQWPARLLGQHSVLSHGLWTLARCFSTANIHADRPSAGKLEAWFTAPLPCPGSARLALDSSGYRLRLEEEKRSRVLLQAEIQPAESEEAQPVAAGEAAE